MPRLLLPVVLVLTGACGSATSSAPATDSGTPARITSTSTTLNVRVAEDPLRSTTVFEAPLDTVWSRLPAAYQALGINPDVTDYRARRLGAQRFTQRRIAGKRTIDLVHALTKVRDHPRSTRGASSYPFSRRSKS